MTPAQLTRGRESFRLSQAELSRLSGVAKHRVSLFESGDIALSVAEERKILLALEAERQRIASLPPIYAEAS